MGEPPPRPIYTAGDFHMGGCFEMRTASYGIEAAHRRREEKSGARKAAAGQSKPTPFLGRPRIGRKDASNVEYAGHQLGVDPADIPRLKNEERRPNRKGSRVGWWRGGAKRRKLLSCAL